MKMFEIPEIQVETISVEDVIATSDGGNGTQLPQDCLVLGM